MNNNSDVATLIWGVQVLENETCRCSIYWIIWIILPLLLFILENLMKI